MATACSQFMTEQSISNEPGQNVPVELHASVGAKVPSSISLKPLPSQVKSPA